MSPSSKIFAARRRDLQARARYFERRGYDLTHARAARRSPHAARRPPPSAAAANAAAHSARQRRSQQNERVFAQKLTRNFWAYGRRQDLR